MGGSARTRAQRRAAQRGACRRPSSPLALGTRACSPAATIRWAAAASRSRRRPPAVATSHPTRAASSPTPPTRSRSREDGDTLATSPTRVGTTARRARAAQRPARATTSCAGEVLLLPETRAAPGTGGLDSGAVTSQPLGWTPDQARPRSTAHPATVRRREANPFQNGQTEPLIDPVRHRVEAGETAYSIARLYGVSVTALASWNGLGPDLAVRDEPGTPDPDRRRRQPDLQRARHAARPGHAGGGAAERRGAAAGRHHRRGRARIARTSAAYRTPPGGRLGAAGVGQGHPALRPGQPERRRLRRAGRNRGACRRTGRGGAGLRGARRPRHDRAGPPQGRPDDHLLDPARTSRSSRATASRPARSSVRSPTANKPSCSSTSSAARPASTRRPTSAAAAEAGTTQASGSAALNDGSSALRT